MYRLKKISTIWGIILTFCLALPWSQALAQTVSGERALSGGESQQIIQKVLNNPNLQLRRLGERVRTLKVRSGVDEKEDRFGFRLRRRRAEVILINYNSGKAYRVLVDPNTGAIARQEELSGRPQPSLEERQEVKQIISRDPEHNRLLASEGVLEGGFAVEPPPDSDPRHRYVQMQVISPDRRSFLRVVIVNLTTGKIVASVRPQ
jgi:hypothetical protein